MSYSIYLGTSCIWSPESVQDDATYALFNISVNLELSKSGSLSFTIYPTHPYYSVIEKLKSIITVYEDDDIIFRGRVINDTLGWLNERKVTCEGELAYLLDSVQRPFTFPTETSGSDISDYLSFLIARHNEQMPTSKQFTLGTVTVEDANGYIARSDTEYSTTWELIQEGLLDTHGGYLCVRYSGTTRYLDYVTDFSVLGAQSIALGQNLLNIATSRSGEDVATAILPLGAKNDNSESRVTIANLPDENETDFVKSGDIVYSVSAETAYGGRIIKTIKWDDVGVDTNLLTKAKAKLSEIMSQTVETVLTAADLSHAGYDVGAFKVGTKVTVTDDYHEDAHGLASSYLVKKITIPILDPKNIKITVGSQYLSFTESNNKALREEFQTLMINSSASASAKVRELEQRVNSSIEQSEATIRATVADEYYTKDETDTKVAGLRTTVEQNADSVNIRFEGMQTDLDAVANNTEATFANWNKYIRFVDGNIILGEEGNQITLKIENDIIQFLDGNAPVAYWTNSKFYVTNAEILTELRLGKFGFIPRTNGNLDFKKVVS